LLVYQDEIVECIFPFTVLIFFFYSYFWWLLFIGCDDRFHQTFGY